MQWYAAKYYLNILKTSSDSIVDYTLDGLRHLAKYLLKELDVLKTTDDDLIEERKLIRLNIPESIKNVQNMIENFSEIILETMLARRDIKIDAIEPSKIVLKFTGVKQPKRSSALKQWESDEEEVEVVDRDGTWQDKEVISIAGDLVIEEEEEVKSKIVKTEKKKPRVGEKEGTYQPIPNHSRALKTPHVISEIEEKRIKHNLVVVRKEPKKAAGEKVFNKLMKSLRK